MSSFEIEREIPVISVVVPVYNTEKYLRRCIDSILAQTFTELELLLIDDGSTDKSSMICDEYAIIDSRVCVYHQENGGVSSARNCGLDNAKGEWITFVDADDWLDINMFQEMYDCARLANADAVYCDIRMVYKDFDDVYKAASFSKVKTEFLRNYIASVWTSLCNTLVKTEIYRKNNLKSPMHLTYCEDFWLSVRMFHYADKISYVAKPHYNYNRINESSKMHSLDLKTEQEERKAYIETIEFFKKEGVFDFYKKEMSWRVLKSTHDSALYPNRYNEFLSIYPESHKNIWSCPYLNFKLKCILSLLRFRISRPLGILLIRLRELIAR